MLEPTDWNQLDEVTKACCEAVRTMTRAQLGIMREKINEDFDSLRDQWQFTRRHYGAILAEIDKLEAAAEQ